MEKILEAALSKAEEAEVYRVKKETTTVKFQANRLKSISSLFKEGAGLRVIRGGKIGFSSINNLNDPYTLVNRALNSAQFGQRAHFHFPPPKRIPPVQCFDPSLSSLKIEQMIEEGEKAIKLVLEEVPYLECEGEVRKAETEVRILNTSGLDESYKKTGYLFFLYAFFAKEGNFLGIEEEEGGGEYKSYSSLLAQRLIKLANLARNEVRISPGTYPAIFTSKAMPLLLQSLMKGINGKLVQKKTSPLMGKMGKPILSPLINIVDDGRFPFGIATSPLDGEGVVSRRTEIVREGVLKDFIYDLQTAGLMRVESTANAARSYDSLPSPSTTNFILEPGNTSFEEMIKDVKEGIIVDQVIGSGQGNDLTGEFSVNLDLGYKVERGKIKGRIKNVMISGNAYKLLNKVIAVGREARGIGSIRTPSVYFEKVNVTG